MTTQSAPGWKLRGTILQACNCDYGCPCNFNAPPTPGNCYGQWTWHIEEGRYGETRLDGLNFTLAMEFPEAIHKGNGEALVLIDEGSDVAQREALQALVTGKAGPPWSIFIPLATKGVHGPKFVPYEVKIDGPRSLLRAGKVMELEMEPIRNPVTGAEVTPQVVLPQGLVYKQSVRGSSKSYWIRDGLHHEYQGKDTAIAPFEYSGP